MRFALSASLCAVASISAGSQAGVVVSSDESVWGLMNAMSSLQVASESFDGFPGGLYPSLSGTTGGVQWTLTSSGGIRVGSGAAAAGSVGSSLTLSFLGGVQSFAGRFFATDSAFAASPALFTVTLSNGTGYSAVAASAAGFAGFTGTGGELISSITITAMGLRDSLPVAPAVDALYFGVIPAPGSLALISAASLLGAGRRRR